QRHDQRAPDPVVILDHQYPAHDTPSCLRRADDAVPGDGTHVPASRVTEVTGRARAHSSWVNRSRAGTGPTATMVSPYMSTVLPCAAVNRAPGPSASRFTATIVTPIWACTPDSLKV